MMNRLSLAISLLVAIATITLLLALQTAYCDTPLAAGEPMPLACPAGW